jgi:NADH-quinone oxidoreductase subunit C
MADDPTNSQEPPVPPVAAGDKPASATPSEPPKTEVPGQTGSAAVPPKPAAPAAARPAAPVAAKPAPAKPAAAEHPPKAAPPGGPPDPPPPADLAVPGFITTLQAAVPGAVTALSYFVGDWTVIVSAAQVLEVMRHLSTAPDAAFDLCSDVTATDWPPRAERFDVVYCLYSTRHRHRVRVKARLADGQPIASVTPVWRAANWLEREVFDMFGISFTGHPDLRRILMPEEWQGYPQRKDYPLEGPGELLMENPIEWLKLRQAKEEAEIE